MEPMLELDVPEVVPAEDEGPFVLRGVMRLREELVRAQGYRHRILEDGRATPWSLDQDTAAAREWFAERGLNLGDPVVASTVLVTIALTRGRTPSLKGQLTVAAIEAIDRLDASLDAPPTDHQLRLFD